MVGKKFKKEGDNIRGNPGDLNEQFFPINPDRIEAQLLDAFESHELSAEEYEKMRDAQERRKHKNENRHID